MPIYGNSSFFSSAEKKNKLRSRNLIVVSILILIGILPIDSFSQPLAAGQSKYLGCATSSYLYRYLDSYWNQISPGNDGKWGTLSNSKDTYNWTNLDKIYNFAISSNRPQPFLFKEHALIWSQQAPGWISNLDSTTLRTSIEYWFKTFGERYPQTAMVDVVNEPLPPHLPTPAPAYVKALGGTGKTGWDWIITAFELARKYMPSGCKLILNEYNVLHDNTITTNYLGIIKLLSDRKLIDGIGVQGHYFEFRSHIDATSGTYVWNVSTIKSNLDRLGATGLPVYITEFDVDEQNDENQLASYKIYFPLFWTHPAVKGITMWGYISSDIWTSHPNTYLIIDDGVKGTERPAMQWLRTYISTTEVKDNFGKIPAEYILNQNYPNPFNPTTSISFSLPQKSDVKLILMDILGREVMDIASGSFDAGIHNVQLNASNLASGIYLYRLQAGAFQASKKLVIVK